MPPIFKYLVTFFRRLYIGFSSEVRIYELRIIEEVANSLKGEKKKAAQNQYDNFLKFGFTVNLVQRWPDRKSERITYIEFLYPDEICRINQPVDVNLAQFDLKTDKGKIQVSVYAAHGIISHLQFSRAPRPILDGQQLVFEKAEFDTPVSDRTARAIDRLEHK
jgi:hypothetical protein